LANTPTVRSIQSNYAVYKGLLVVLVIIDDGDEDET